MNSTFILASLIEPAIGLIFWTTITFILLLVLLGKFAWKPILSAIKTREKGIEDALASAETALKDMRELKSNNERILQEARDTKDTIIAEAKTKSQVEADRIMSSAREQITNEKNAAIAELKNQVATLSIEIAEKILRSELSSDEKQKALVSNLMKDVNLN
jgi:F-type H+-transporting ATPase subunit b